jgi:hypothetical protein
MIAGLEAGLMEETGFANDKLLLEHLVPLAEGLGHDPFAIHAELSATGAAFPADHRAAMAAERATSSTASLRDAALGFLLDADPAPGRAGHLGCAGAPKPSAEPPGRRAGLPSPMAAAATPDQAGRRHPRPSCQCGRSTSAA